MTAQRTGVILWSVSPSENVTEEGPDPGGSGMCKLFAAKGPP